MAAFVISEAEILDGNAAREYSQLAAPLSLKLASLGSDGLWNYFQKTGDLSIKVAEIKMRHGAPVTAYQVCDALVAEANARAGHITVPLFQN